MKKFYILLAGICMTVTAFTQSVFDNPITGTNPNTANPYTTGQTTDPNLTASGIGRGTGISGANANDRYNANSWNTAAIDLTAYFEFTITPNSGKTVSFISFVYTGQASGSGATAFAFRSSVDGFTNDIGTPLATGATIDLSAGAYQNISSAITFRLYGWGASAAAGTFSVNDFTFNGVTSVLPVTLSYFTGAKLSNALSINWKAECSNAGNVEFTVERSADGRSFNSVNVFTASAVRCQQPFEYIDNNPLPGKNFYRLKINEFNGKIFSSSIISLLNSQSGVDIAGISPTLVKNNAVLSISAAQKTSIQMVVANLAGQQVKQYRFNLVAGSNQLPVDMSSLASGIYQVTGITNEGQKITVRFVKE